MVAVEKIKNNSTYQKIYTKIKNNKKTRSWKRLIDIGLNLKGSLEKDCNFMEQRVLKKTAENSEMSKEGRCDLRWLSQELEWPTVAPLSSTLFTRADVEKKVFIGRLKHERSTEVAFPPLNGWCNFLVGQLEQGRWKNSKEVLLLTVESEMKWYFPTNQEKYFFVFWPTFRSILNFFQFLQLLKKTSVARLRWPHPFWFGKPSAGHKKGARGSLPARGPILWPPLM